ncbi:MAG: efflux RND transporter periplasmic adaptor subunit [Planctomycetota bacterium]
MSAQADPAGSEVDGSVDLAGLARRKAEVEPPRRGWLRLAVPLSILGAFAFVLRGTIADLLVERTTVSLVRPARLARTSAAADQPIGSVTEAEAGVTASAPVERRLAVQAAGWVEPDPFPALVPALAGGVLESVEVQEADRVEAGTVVARLVADDARLAHAEAQAHLRTARASRELSRVRSELAVETFDEALDVKEAVASADAIVRGRVAEAALRAEAVREGEARVGLAESEVVVQKELDAAGAAGVRQVEIAEAELLVAKARLGALQAEAAHAEARVDEARASLTRARGEERLRLDDRLRRDEAQAALAKADADVAAAEAALATAALRLKRVAIVAPAAGVVLERLAVAGETLTPGQPVASLYEPDRLRVRVDVPQSDVAAIAVGQAAEVLADVRPDRPYSGEVIRIVERADIQKVTLEAQVRVTNDDGRLRPDMLTQVRFFEGGGDDGRAEGASSARGGGLDRQRAGSASSTGSRYRLALPEPAVRGGFAWILDPLENAAVRVEVEVGAAVGEGLPEGAAGKWVTVRSGINLTDKVVLDGRTRLEERRSSGGGDRQPIHPAEEGGE